MTLPASGPLSVNQINVEVGSSGTTQRTLQAIDDLILPAQRGTDPNIGQCYSKAYYQKNNEGNCNNGNCNCGNCNCGIFNCNNCFPNGNVNCLNCQTQNWLQSDCNCATAYNCVNGQFSYDCDCDCDCDCACR
jgi:hypothetical protein